MNAPSASNIYKTPLQTSLNRAINNKIVEASAQSGKALPCHVVAVDGSIVTVAFDVVTDATLPQVTIPIIAFEYIRFPIRVGCKGMTISADARIGVSSGIGGSAPRLDAPANMTALVFVPLGNATWEAIDPEALYLYSQLGCFISIGPTEIQITAPDGLAIAGDVAVTGKLSTTAALEAGNGATGSFVAGAKTVTVIKGIITSIVP